MNQTLKSEKDWFSKPGDSLKLLIRRRGLTVEQIATGMSGGEETLRNIFGGTAAIDTKIAGELAATIGGTKQFWLNRQSLYDSSLKQAVQEAADLEPEQWLDQVPDPLTVKSRNKKDLELHAQLHRRLQYFNVPTFDGWFEQYGKHASETPFRESPAFESQESSKLLWLRRGELEAELVSTDIWNPSVLKESLPDIRKLTKISKPYKFLPKLREILASSGVALAVVKAPKKCHVSGATRMIATDKAMLLVSFRYRSDDQFWFTVFHEIGHLLLHGARTFVDNDHSSTKDIEKEANQFARECIIPNEAMGEFRSLRLNRQSVLRFSTRTGVATGLVVGQMQHAKMIRPDQFNKLKRFWKWEDINAVVV